ncbi:TPA: LysR family transcriptional regulator, partial [Pseudomonas aeruginosa]|nr:LysR family transcriptional regulator [Pseudomonas aeruginosa]
LRSGRLQLVLPDWSSMGAPFCLYYPSRRQPQPGLRQLMEMIRGDWLGRA